MILNKENVNAAINFALIDNSVIAVQTYMSYQERLSTILKIYEKWYYEFSKSKSFTYGIEKLTTFEEVALLIDVIKTVNLIPCDGMKKNNLVAFTTAMKLCEEPVIAYMQDFMVEDAEKGESINLKRFIDNNPNGWNTFKTDFILNHSNKKEIRYNRVNDYMDFVYYTYLDILASQTKNENVLERVEGYKFSDRLEEKKNHVILP